MRNGGKCATDSVTGRTISIHWPWPINSSRKGRSPSSRPAGSLKGKKSLDFGRYALLDHIGQGARGRVFKARHRLMDRVVALKVFLPGDKRRARRRSPGSSAR